MQMMKYCTLFIKMKGYSINNNNCVYYLMIHKSYSYSYLIVLCYVKYLESISPDCILEQSNAY
ncbi:uncharacterized protein BX663DRAFT_515432 [Cokeromyces recurvatus]|uniref:uncharacterized protein n=1 Tax=Cokeromyces recurvatus TaxID=90255 RepID=UPI00221F24D6|nr:uncharacterized protein BX663DRAFT_515432 [Cokeromyces recurvatus]KAI7901259.1 hypothetical protein BX663DRAFT_515432 [Cokeromyces recurvatus]